MGLRRDDRERKAEAAHRIGFFVNFDFEVLHVRLLHGIIHTSSACVVAQAHKSVKPDDIATEPVDALDTSRQYLVTKSGAFAQRLRGGLHELCAYANIFVPGIWASARRLPHWSSPSKDRVTI